MPGFYLLDSLLSGLLDKVCTHHITFAYLKSFQTKTQGGYEMG
jgi:hypothetical protein